MNHILPLLVFVGLFTCCLSQQLILTSQTDIQEVTSASSRHDLNDLTSQTDITEVTSSRHDLNDLTSQTDITEVTSSRHDLNDLTSQADIQEVTSSRHDLNDLTSQTDIQEVTSSRHDLNDLTSQTEIQEVTSSRHDLNDLTSQTDIQEVTSSRHDLNDLTSQTEIQEVTSSRHDLNDLTSQTDIQEVTSSRHDLTDITNINVQFLVFIGEQYNNCNATVSTPYIKAGQSWNDAPTINISNCDSGKFMFQIQQDNKTKELTVTVNYYTKAYSIGPPPSCDFKWKGDYQVPTAKNMELSPLPGCYYHFTDKEDYHSDFMFQMLTWQWF